MNYYERHLGDYAKNAAHLSLLEHGIYVRLMDVYYARESPIPDAMAARLVAARTEPETQALQVVLQEFFQLRDGHWHQDRCDQEIAAYQAGEPEREAKKANEETRLKRHREERARLFEILTDARQHAPWNTSMRELREMVSALEKATANTQPATPVQPLPATAPATPATATHSPLPTPHIEEIGRAHPADPESDEQDEPPAPIGTQAGRICKALRAAGVASANPGDPRLLALLAQGATEDEFIGLADEAKGKGSGFAWLLAALVARRAEAASIVLAPAVPKTDPAAKTVQSKAAEQTAALLRADQEHRAEVARQREKRRLAEQGKAA